MTYNIHHKDFLPPLQQNTLSFVNIIYTTAFRKGFLYLLKPNRAFFALKFCVFCA